MNTQLPFPIAFPYQLIAAGRDPATRYERLVRCYEAVVRYCATVQISDYVAAGCPGADLNRKFMERLYRNFSLGHWIEITRDIISLQKKGVLAPFMREMSDFYFKPGKGASLTAAGEIFDSVLCKARNEWAHPDQTWGVDAFVRKFEDHKPLLDQLLSALEFLAHYNLYVPYRGSRPEKIQEAFLLMGPSEHPRLELGLNLELSPQIVRHLEYEMTAFLVSNEDPSRQLPLFPLSLFANRDGSEDIFLFDGCDIRKEAVRRILYRGIRIGQKPLEAAPGSDFDRVVEAFRSMLAILAPPQAAAAAPVVAGPEEEDLSTHYFSVQQRIIEENTKTFVGRVEVQQALDKFMSDNSRGYFVIQGGPGLGKTAVSCDLVKRHIFAHHFINRTGGRSDPRLILCSLMSQLIPRAGIQISLPETLSELTRAFENLLTQLAARHSPLVIVVDALDELITEPGNMLSFLVSQTIPEGVYFVVTSRPGEQLDLLLRSLTTIPEQVYELGPLGLSEMYAILHLSNPDLPEAQMGRIAEVSGGNPLYLRAVVEELEKDAKFDFNRLPSGIEGFFARSVCAPEAADPLLRDVLGLLAAARKPLSLRELSQITGERQRRINEVGIRPIRSFLMEVAGQFSFYHARFYDFVVREFLYEDELPQYHERLAVWLQQPESRSYDYYWMSLAYHLFEAGKSKDLLPAISREFLAEKVRRFGYAVLEDVEIIARCLLKAGDPALVERCVDVVEGLREVVGGDLIDDAARTMRSHHTVESFRSRIMAPSVPSVPGLELYAGMLPQADVIADFFEMIPVKEQLCLAIGDIPGTGLKSAFIARFLGNIFRQMVQDSVQPHFGQILWKINTLISGSEFFPVCSMQCMHLDPVGGVMTLANAGHPLAVLYSRRNRRCDILPVRGPLFHADLGDSSADCPQRRFEVGPGDIIVLLSDGLTQGHVLIGDPYGYRFTKLVEQKAEQSARTIGEAILNDWIEHTRQEYYIDDVTAIIVKLSEA